jgi:putative SOS response-associated peptidase YedK
MCGRYKLTIPFREIVRLYDLTQPNTSRFDNMPPRYNIARRRRTCQSCVWTATVSANS